MADAAVADIVLSPGQVLDETLLAAPQERKANVLSVRMICPECLEDPPNLVEENRDGILVCGSCGFVMQTDCIDYRSEWRNFKNDDSNTDDPSRVGETANPLFNGSQLSSEISYVGGNAMNRELHRAQNRSNEDKNNKILKDGYAILERFADHMHASNQTTNNAKLLYKNVLESKQFRGKSEKSLIAACLFIACRSNKVPRSFKEITAVTKVPKKELGRTFKILEIFFKKKHVQTERSVAGNPANEWSSPSAGPEELCGRFGNILGIDRRTSNKAGECARILLDRGLLAGRSPLSVAAVALYILSNLMGIPKTAKEVGQACAVSDGTIRTAWRKIYNERLSIIQDDWIKEGGKVENLPPQ